MNPDLLPLLPKYWDYSRVHLQTWTWLSFEDVDKHVSPNRKI